MRLNFSSDALPLALRKDAIDAAFGVHVQGNVDFCGEAPPHVALAMRSVAGVHLARIDCSPIRLMTPSADDGLVYLSITASGGGMIDAGGKDKAVHAGDFTVMHRDRRCTTVVAQRSEILSVALPRAQILPRLASEDMLHAPISRAHPATRLLYNYAATLIADGDLLSPADESVLATHITDLVAMSLGATEGDAAAPKGGVRAARLRAIKADIAANLSLPELALDWLARRHGVSTAYIRALFSAENSSFTDYVLAGRLDHVHALLASPYMRHQSIAALALMAGFGDISWFNQAFRRRFGMTPSDVRASRRERPNQSSAHP